MSKDKSTIRNEQYNDFCFLVFAYNQEKYVFQHLESIKYLIRKYGVDKSFQLVFSDDSSTDNTLKYAELWINANRGLFNEIIVVRHEKNVGTIRNMQDGSSKVNAVAFKGTACDDLYYNNNIFELYKKGDVVVTPTIHFWNNGYIRDDIGPDYIGFLYYRYSNKLKKIIAKMLDYNQCIPSPGVFLNKDIWFDEGLQKYMSNFKFIEDIPEWHYIFNLYEKEYSLYIEDKPYVLYRREVGVSNSIKKKDSPVALDYNKVRTMIKCKKDAYPKMCNIYVYQHFIKSRIYNWFIVRFTQVTKSLNNWNDALKEVQNHLDYIESKAKECCNNLLGDGKINNVNM